MPEYMLFRNIYAQNQLSRQSLADVALWVLARSDFWQVDYQSMH